MFSSIYVGLLVGLLTVSASHIPSLFRRHTAGGEVVAAVEAQHACGICGRVVVAASFFRANHVDRGDYGRQLWHPAWPQLYATQTHHQPVPHCCHPPLLEHAAWVMYMPATTHNYKCSSLNPACIKNIFLYSNLIWGLFCFKTRTVLYSNSELLFCWYSIFKSSECLKWSKTSWEINPTIHYL